ncbi:Cyclic di-GMP phosphodiesterase Gmr [Aquicella siphonis]|uniref:Cyclic di-GMP phosphodiesterase Gmr n=1 Tax=Aquicella siphonis TaxID=254247 RepID=A0A5E4PLS1_9COXI|nr:sensor domain-containing diguanylate cyclase [Aquicella siphonis]VVC77202.1 Cyclic di-GMP phosphodiesterase Gmr [Aquicella siphonis]
MGQYLNMRLVSAFQKASLLLGLLICLMGLLALIVWIPHMPAARSFLPSLASIKPGISAVFVLTGMSLLLQASPLSRDRLILNMTGKLIGVIILLLGLIPLAEYVTGQNFHLGELIRTSQTNSGSSYSFIQTLPGIFISIVFIGLALVLLDMRHTDWMVQASSFIVGLYGLSIISGTGSQINAPLQSLTYSQSTVYIAIVFTFVAAALFCIRPEKGIMSLFISDTTGGIVARWLVPLVVLIPVIFGNLWIYSHEANLYDFMPQISRSFITITAIYLIMILFVSHMLMKADIRRKTAEMKLQKSHDEIEDLYNHAPCGYHSLDDKGIFIRMNDTELEWLGYQRDEIMGKMKLFDLLADSSRQTLGKHFKHPTKWASLKNQEMHLTRKNGTSLIVLYNAHAKQHPDGSLIMSRATMFDITEQKKVEKALQISEEQFRNAMDIAPIGMAIVALDGQFIEVNHSLCQIVGYPKNELEKKSFQQITYPDDLSTDLVRLKQLTEGKIQSYHLDKRYIRKDGKIIWVQLTVSLQRDSLTHDPLFFISQVEDITERKLMEDKIRQLAYHDSLTRLPNRRMLIDRLNHAIALAKRHHHILAVMFLDLDKFKHINDTLGHDIGDELLKAVAVRLSLSLRKEDTIARLSGDEFVIVLNEINNALDAESVARKILDKMRQPFLIMGHELQSGISIGIAIFPQDGNDTIELLKHADSAMYASKESGTNQYQFYQG